MKYTSGNHNAIALPIYRIIFIIEFFIAPFYSSAQIAIDSVKKEYCVPTVAGMPRGKGVVFKYHVIPDYSIKSVYLKDNTTNTAEITRNGRLEFKVRFPVFNKPYLSVITGVSYSQEQFHFGKIESEPYAVAKSLDDRSLKSAGMQVHVIKPTLSNTYFLLRLSADLNGDFMSGDNALSEYLKISVAPMYGWKRSDDLSYAVGLMYGYIFGRPSIYPLLSYNRNFNTKLGLESALPAYVRLRYSQHDRSFWYANVNIEGASYRLKNNLPGLEGIEKPHLHRSGLVSSVMFEHEIHNWLWFSVEAGYRFNLLFNITNSPARNAEVLIKSKVGTAPIFGISLFAVAPKKKTRSIENYGPKQL